ncbi:MAG: hypothetical protein ACRELT_12835, partial [Longimicrobiales bacterium]
MRRNAIRRNALLTAVALVSLTAAACNNPVRPEEHPEAGGVVIFSAGTNTVLTQTIGANAAFTAPLTVTLGQPLEVEIMFLDASDPTNLDLAFHPDADEGESLRVTVTGSPIITYQDHGDHGDFEPTAAGETTVRIE